jgi:hypothetical protein
MLIFLDTCLRQQVFGGFNSVGWECLTKKGYYGTGECFVFSIKPKMAFYKWTEANDYFVSSTKDFIGMGGGYAWHPFLNCDFF